MLSRREFVQRAFVGAAAVAAVGCSRSDADDFQLRGLQPIKYGEAPSQLAELLVPDEFGPYPVVVIIHGGWWQTGWDRRGVREVARDLAKEGYATWNLEYRLVGEEGGGWPGTFEDVALGIDTLADSARDYNLDLSRVVFLGHSAGGHLALWAASRGAFEPGFVGADPQVQPATVVALAPVPDLVTAAQDDLGDGAVQQLLLGSPEEVPLTYAVASPQGLEPGPARHVLYHAVDDGIVPIEQSRAYAARLQEIGAQVELVELPSGGHFGSIVVGESGWTAVRDRMAEFAEPLPTDDE